MKRGKKIPFENGDKEVIGGEKERKTLTGCYHESDGEREKDTRNHGCNHESDGETKEELVCACVCVFVCLWTWDLGL